jgi:hypothetical protein
VGKEPDKIKSAGEGGARVSSDEAEVRIRETTLSRTKKNAHRLFVTCALVNLFVSRRKLLAGA